MTEWNTEQLSWHTAVVDGRPAHYSVGGDGKPLLFLHGWGLTDRSYSRSLRRLVSAGLRVYAPAMPGFGGTADLPSGQRNLTGYARWVTAFAEEIGITEPVTLVGHSFGGGVAIRTAHDAPELVARLVLVNSIGGSAWSDSRGVLKAIGQRPLWDWGLHLQSDLLTARSLTRVLPVILRDAVPNLMRSPGAIWRVANLARTADLTPELAELNRRQLPVVIVWSLGDNVIPEATLMSLRAGLDDSRMVTVPGSHSWLLADPLRFGEVITNVLALAEPLAELDERAEPA
jgi:pimeloyl-ACP methyl ester carboxylesterase